MRNELANSKHVELSKELSFPGDVRFDPDRITLHGRYADQLSAYRAKKIWSETLETCFLLEPDHDFNLDVKSSLTDGEFMLNCSFASACGRYAFWRLTNEQAPEAQYILETAHIPNSESQLDNLIGAPDLRPAIERAMDEIDAARAGHSKIKRVLKSLISAITRRY